jgi:hypothetical protein
VTSWRQIGTKINASVGRGGERPGQGRERPDGDSGRPDGDSGRRGRGSERPGRRAALRTGILAGATAVGAVALAQRPGSASASSYVVTDPLTNNTCVLPSGDTTGATDTTNINGALAANLNGQNVVLAAGVFYVDSPIMIPPGGVLKGQFANENTEFSNHAWGSCLTAVTTWAPVTIAGSGGAANAVNAVVACVGQQTGNYPYPGEESKVYGVMIDCSQVPRSLTNVDGLQIFGDLSRPHMERVLITYAPGSGFNMVNSSFGGPDAARLERVNVRYSVGVGFNHVKISDCTYYDCLCENGQTDGFYIQNGSNCVWAECRSEHNGTSGAGNGYTYECTSTSTGSGGMKLIGCSTDRNEAHGIYITTGNGSAGPVLLSGCVFRRDGRNGKSGGGDYAGITVASYPGPVQVSGCTVWPGVDDSPSGTPPSSGTPSPNYGMRLASNSASTQVMVGASYIQGAGEFLSDDGTTADVRWGPDVAGASGTTSAPVLRTPRMGQSTLSGGNATVPSTCVTANSIIQLTPGFVNGGTPGILRVSGRTAGSGFDVTSTSSDDASSFYWQIMNP